MLRLWRSAAPKESRRTPRKRGIQYAAASRFNHWCLWNIGSPGQAGRRQGVCATHDIASRSRRAFRASFAINFPPSANRGRREDRVRAAPAVSRAICTKKCAHEHTGSAESIRPSLRNGFTAYGALSLVSRALLPPSPARSLLLTNLTPASGARTTRFRRPRPPRSSVAASASTASHRAFRDVRNAPLAG